MGVSSFVVRHESNLCFSLLGNITPLQLFGHFRVYPCLVVLGKLSALCLDFLFSLILVQFFSPPLRKLPGGLEPPTSSDPTARQGPRNALYLSELQGARDEPRQEERSSSFELAGIA